jgi:P27 family predicted phage terminase small subunit
MRGRKPIPTHLKLIRGNPGHQKLNKNELQPSKPSECPEPPSTLDEFGAEEWRLVAGELWAMGVYTRADKGALTAYCYAYSVWRTAAESIKKLADNDPVMHGQLAKRDGGAVANPLIAIARRAAGDMVRYASEFGFTPAARARIAAGVDNQEPRRFEGLLA